jgi:anti-sigma regulatory factor (Ser/Thr protein kinase)
MHSDPPRPPGLFCHTYVSRLDAFEGLVRALTAWADAAGVAPPTLRDVVLILDELFSNIVIHGYRHDPNGEIRVEAALQDQQVHVTLTDHAPLFNPLLVPEPDTTLPLEARPIGGLGLLFVRRTADELRYWPTEPNSPGSANRLRFTKFL